jgi:hypothetical protein
LVNLHTLTSPKKSKRQVYQTDFVLESLILFYCT